MTKTSPARGVPVIRKGPPEIAIEWIDVTIDIRVSHTVIQGLYLFFTITRAVLENPSPTARDLRPERNLEGNLGGMVMDFPMPPNFWWSMDILSSSFYSEWIIDDGRMCHPKCVTIPIQGVWA